jgi:hypothetical protein
LMSVRTTYALHELPFFSAAGGGANMSA